MNTSAAWDDYALFAAVARSGGLAQAARETGLSKATLGRRMRALETRFGRRLFRHGRDGYTLTSDGAALAAKVRGMEAAAAEIGKWREEAAGPVCVRISAGMWTALDLAENLPLFWDRSALWLPEFVHCERPMDIARREIDIGIRNARPDQPWLAGRKVGEVAFAVYGRGPEVTGWIGMAHGTPETPSLRWLMEHHGDDIVTKANNPKLAATMARAGIGRVVMPTFMGDRFDGLQRLSDPIPELAGAQWLVSHHDGRNEAPIRAALDALAGYLRVRGTARA